MWSRESGEGHQGVCKQTVNNAISDQDCKSRIRPYASPAEKSYQTVTKAHTSHHRTVSHDHFTFTLLAESTAFSAEISHLVTLRSHNAISAAFSAPLATKHCQLNAQKAHGRDQLFWQPSAPLPASSFWHVRPD